MSELRILTVRQPYAWAIIHGGKDIENRSRNIAGDYRGPVAIHAALKGASFDAKHPKLWPFDERHTTGVIIGVVDLVGVHHSESCAEYTLIEKTPARSRTPSHTVAGLVCVTCPTALQRKSSKH